MVRRSILVRAGVTLAAGISALIVSTSAQAALIYQETFPITTGTTNAARLAATGWVNGGNTSATGNGVFAESGTAFTGDRDGATAADGILFQYRPSAAASAVYTTEQTIDFSQFDSIVFDWDQRGDFNGLGIDVRVAVQVGGSWYASGQAYPTLSEGTTAPWEPTQLAYNPAAANWLNLTMGSGTTAPAVGAVPTSNLVGNITGFGFVAANGTVTTDINETVHFDQLSITGNSVPEPASLGLLGVVGSAMLLRRRRA